MASTSITPASSQSGFSLLEILISIVIISFGLLGVAALQVTGLKNNQSAFQRSSATVLAYDMLDRMRANRTAMKSGAYHTGGDFKDYATNKVSSPGNMKDKDMNDWLEALSKRLPSGAGKIEAAAGASTVRVTVQWSDARGTGGSSTQTLSVESQGCALGETCNF